MPPLKAFSARWSIMATKPANPTLLDVVERYADKLAKDPAFSQREFVAMGIYTPKGNLTKNYRPAPKPKKVG